MRWFKKLFENDVEKQESDPKVVKDLIEKNWIYGVKVVFRKKDNSLRTMFVKLNESLLAPKDEVGKGVEARRKTNKANGNLVVTECIPDEGRYQIRTIPLKQVVSVEAL